MPAKQVYEYAFIRYVPVVERGECLNIGVIVFCKRRNFLQLKYHLDAHRLTAFFRDADLAELTRYLTAWKLICDGHADGGPIARLDPPERFRWLTAARSTIIQCSKVHPGLSEDPAAVLEELFGKYVL